MVLTPDLSNEIELSVSKILVNRSYFNQKLTRDFYMFNTLTTRLGRSSLNTT